MLSPYLAWLSTPVPTQHQNESVGVLNALAQAHGQTFVDFLRDLTRDLDAFPDGLGVDHYMSGVLTLPRVAQNRPGETVRLKAALLDFALAASNENIVDQVPVSAFVDAMATTLSLADLAQLKEPLLALARKGKEKKWKRR